MKKKPLKHSLNNSRKATAGEFYFFHLAGGGRIRKKVFLPEIWLARYVTNGHTDVQLFLKSNLMITIRGCSLKELIKITGFLKQVNKEDLVSPDAVDTYEEDVVYLYHSLTYKGEFISLSLHRPYKKAFLSFFHYYEM